jgi:hypothetical protein
LASQSVEPRTLFEVIEPWVFRNRINLPKVYGRLLTVTVWFVFRIVIPEANLVRNRIIETEKTLSLITIVTD